MDQVAPAEGASGHGATSEGAPGITGPDAILTSMKRTASATPYRFRDLLALDDFERHARRLLPPMIFHYVAGGVETGAALRNSRENPQNVAEQLLRCVAEQAILNGTLFVQDDGAYSLNH